jgi:hypothetical protein
MAAAYRQGSKFYPESKQDSSAADFSPDIRTTIKIFLLKGLQIYFFS